MKQFAALVLAAAVSLPAAAGTVSWTNWNGYNGSLTQNGESIGVSYTGNAFASDHSAWIYDVPSSFTNAEVSNTPGSNGTLLMTGGNNQINTIRFSKPVVNPYIALISVGQGGVPVSFQFQNVSSLDVIVQGPGHWGGGSLSASGTTVTGREGNGVVRLNGVYSEISFLTPNYEYYYGATVGAAVTAVPEAETWAMLGLGLGALGFFARRRKAA
ncbi:PEP-CTERM sorting domain-containing protein [Massilia sp. W12]|uniref:PEP-CTERM sorting domain-containing protein n=1 Tax=Massilia sp. W12 TaxID=3126507 RepID=UPI0030CD96F8